MHILWFALTMTSRTELLQHSSESNKQLITLLQRRVPAGKIPANSEEVLADVPGSLGSKGQGVRESSVAIWIEGGLCNRVSGAVPGPLDCPSIGDNPWWSSAAARSSGPLGEQ